MTSLTPPTPRSYTFPVEFVLCPGGASERRREDLLVLMHNFASDVGAVPVALPRRHSGRSEVFEILAKGYGDEEVSARREVSKQIDDCVSRMMEHSEADEEWDLDFVY